MFPLRVSKIDAGGVELTRRPDLCWRRRGLQAIAAPGEGE